MSTGNPLPGTRVRIPLTDRPGDHAVVRVIAAPRRDLARAGRLSEALRPPADTLPFAKDTSAELNPSRCATATAASRGSTAATSGSTSPPPRNTAANTIIRSRADSVFIRSATAAIPSTPNPVSISASAPSVRQTRRPSPPSVTTASPLAAFIL